jgi:DNA-binding transcriptional LysR family regulator
VTGRQLRSLPLRRDHFVIALPPDHPDAGARGPVRLARFRDSSWVWLPREISPDYHDELVTACRSAGFSPEPSHYANSIHSQLAMVEAGLGVTLAPESSVRRQGRGIAWHELAERVDLVELSIVTRRESPEPLVESFLSSAESEQRT